MKSDVIHIPLELELRRDRICPWCTEADVISTGCIPVVFIKEIVAPRRQCHRLLSEMGIDTIPPIIQWTGLHADRVSTLTQEMAAGNSPSCLITHALYKRLSPSIQSKYATLYYIRHICCYCAE